MPGEIAIPLPNLYAFLLVLLRVGGVFTFAPIPGIRVGPSLPRIVLAVGVTMALYGRWPTVPVANPGIAELTAWAISEAVLGIMVGLLVGFLTEIFSVGAQTMSLPAGYTYASSIDPATQAESNVLVVLAQLVSGLLFFAFGLDRQIIRLLADSLQTLPPGSFAITQPMAAQVLAAGGLIFNTGFRFVLPILALLAMVDISLALLGRLNAQLQVLTLAFPVKMMVSLLLLTTAGAVMPRLFNQTAQKILLAVRDVLS